MSEPTHVRNLIPPECLSLEHLLEAVAGHTCVRDLAARYELRSLADKSPCELQEQGATPAAARRLACAFELGRRLGRISLLPGSRLRTSQQIFEAYRGRLRDLRVEQFWGVFLNSKNFVLHEMLISQGILTASLVHPREVFAPAIRARAAGIVLVHNHPSSDPEPSPEDHEVTHRIAAVGELVGIKLLDHLVIADGRYVSFLERGLIAQG